MNDQRTDTPGSHNRGDYPDASRDPVPTDKPKRSSLGVLGIIVLLGVVVGVFAMRFFAVAPVPDAFAQEIRLEAALEQAQESGRVVVAVATADYCPPCQRLKRTTLADARVSDWLEANAVPVYVDTAVHTEEAQALGVRYIPAVYVIRDGAIVKSFTGYQDAERTLAFLEEAASGAAQVQ